MKMQRMVELAEASLLGRFTAQQLINDREGKLIRNILDYDLNTTRVRPLLSPHLIEDGNLTQKELSIFIENIENRAAYFKGSLFANGQNRDEELTFTFAINSKFDGFNVSRNVMFNNKTGEGPT